MPSKASKFFNGVGRSIGRGASSLVNEAGKATGTFSGLFGGGKKIFKNIQTAKFK